jgi:hypothetical protein
MKNVNLLKLNNKIYFIIFLFVIFCSCSNNTNEPSNSINEIICIDTVYSFIPGEGQNDGQDSEYYPINIFGLPYPGATENTPVKGPEYVLSIGLGGEITVGFIDYIIVDKSGTDFIIFENSFLNPVNDKYFAEPAIISVSRDGINYIQFEFDSLSLEGCAGVIPTFGNPAKPETCGGDKFDLNTIGIDSITHIKIKDISRTILDNPEHPFYDAIISGFDLDAVVGINFEKKL